MQQQTKSIFHNVAHLVTVVAVIVTREHHVIAVTSPNNNNNNNYLPSQGYGYDDENDVTNPPPPLQQQSNDQETSYYENQGSNNNYDYFDNDERSRNEPTTTRHYDDSSSYRQQEPQQGDDESFAWQDQQQQQERESSSGTSSSPLSSFFSSWQNSGTKSDDNNSKQSNRPPPPPIDYSFPPMKEETPLPRSNRKSFDNDDNDEIPLTSDAPEDGDFPEQQQQDGVESSSSRGGISARQDAIGRVMSTSRGRISLCLSSTLVGLGIGTLLGQSLWQKPKTFLTNGFGLVFFLGSYFRGNSVFGELSKSLGIALMWLGPRWMEIRKDYPTGTFILQAMGVNGARPARRRRRRPLPSPIFTIVAMALVGSTLFGNLSGIGIFFILPKWMLATIGAALFAMWATLPSSWGNVGRTMGRRVVALVQTLWEFQVRLSILQKMGHLSSNILDRLLILDRQHNVRKRLAAVVGTVTRQVQNQMNNSNRDRNNNDEYGEDANENEGRRSRQQRRGDGQEERAEAGRRSRQSRDEQSPRDRQRYRGRPDGPTMSKEREKGDDYWRTDERDFGRDPSPYDESDDNKPEEKKSGWKFF